MIYFPTPISLLCLFMPCPAPTLTESLFSVLTRIISELIGYAPTHLELELARTRPVQEYAAIPIMNRTWSQIIESKKSAFAAKEMVVWGKLWVNRGHVYLQYRPEDVIADSHQRLLKSFWLKIGFSSEHYRKHVNELGVMLQGNMFPAVRYLSLTLCSEHSYWSSRDVVKQYASA
ncbi:hypothetical protein DL89DRAFT_299174 [Linderina pennispora]|uniref:Uncharacterized protein n=1 Tax=Linderina pennispora TaxID=61395 RepID=A0A1Y1WKZ1_9FUNG|nr:uncharacterized protein DL89DRAFT_299174 [Linderina pennispora]ORX73754.1 hypothetical protein DL89DRAFT_299174 [Linderina pennispora]